MTFYNSSRTAQRILPALKAAGGAALATLLLAAPAAAQPIPRPHILKLYETADPKQDSVFMLGNYLTFEVAGLNEYLRTQEQLLIKQNVAPDDAHTQARNLILYINDAPLIGLAPEDIYTYTVAHKASPGAAPALVVEAADSGVVVAPVVVPATVATDTLTKVIFHLTRHPATYRYWNVVYNSPWEFSHPGKIGLGYADRVITDMHPHGEKSLRLKLVRPVALGIALAVVLLLALAMLQLGRKSWMLRSNVPLGWTPPPGQEPMYSLAKTQLAWWTFLVLGAYLLIYCVTGEMTNISTTTLELIGLSAGTAGVSSLIGSSTANPATAPPPVSRGWWLDLITDAKGVSIHRLQQVGFTLLMGYLFIRTVYKTVALPEWDQNEILLLSISSATYLGLKTQENANAATNAALTQSSSFSTTPANSVNTANIASQPNATSGTGVTVTGATPASSVVVSVTTAASGTGTSATTDPGSASSDGTNATATDTSLAEQAADGDIPPGGPSA